MELLECVLELLAQMSVCAVSVEMMVVQVLSVVH